MSTIKDKAHKYTESQGDCSQLLDIDNRNLKSKKIRSILEEHINKKFDSLKILDLGCSYGIILNEFTDSNLCVGVDLDMHALSSGLMHGYSVCSDAESLPFSSDSFDVVICNHVYEHTDDACQLMKEIKRILCAGGCCYFAGPNKFALIEPHYELPFLSWLPNKLANIYIHIFKGLQAYNVKPLSYSKIKWLTQNFDATEYTGKVLYDPEKYFIQDMVMPNTLRQWVALFVYKYMKFIFPGFIFVLVKK